MATQGFPAAEPTAGAAVVVGPELVVVAEVDTLVLSDPPRVSTTITMTTATTTAAAPTIRIKRRRAAFFLAASAAAILASRPVLRRLRFDPATGET